MTDKQKGGPLSVLAGRWCNDPAFLTWLQRTEPDLEVNSRTAADWIREKCRVLSRSEIDHEPRAMVLFHFEIRIPYMDYLKSTTAGD
jgi:hypothetical protein